MIERKAVTTRSLRALKGKRPIVCVTAYDALMARHADAAGVDLILVGDSVGTTLLGFETTVPVTLDMVVHHCGAVSRARTAALVVADVPFGVAHGERSAVLTAAVRLMQEGGALAVKIEGGESLAPTIGHLVDAGVPVLGHVGLLPQRYFALGGYRKFGNTAEGSERLLREALAVQKAGVFAVIGEMIAPEASDLLTRELEVPFIGIGCGHPCDGQILVSTDLLGMGCGSYPSFVKQYADLGKSMQDAFRAYAREVHEGVFPPAG